MDKVSINLLRNQLSLDDPVLDIAASTWDAIIKKEKIWIVICIWASVLWVVLWWQLVKNDTSPDPRGLFGIFLPYLILYAVVHNRMRHIFMMQFAQAKNLLYQRFVPLPPEPAHFFQIGHHTKVEDMITGKVAGRDIQLFYFFTTIGSGKSAQHLGYTVFNINVPYTVPSAVLTKKSGWFTPESNSWYTKLNKPLFQKQTSQADANSYSRDRVSLEGLLDKMLDLRVEKKFEIEALQIFTESFLNKVATIWNGYGIELINQDIYVYSSRMITTRKELEHLFELAEEVIKHTENMLERVGSSTDAMKLHTQPKQAVK